MTEHLKTKVLIIGAGTDARIPYAIGRNSPNQIPLGPCASDGVP